MRYNLIKILTFLFLQLNFFMAAIANESDLPDLGATGAAAVTEAEEYRTGSAVIRNLQNAGLIINDPLITDYLNQLGYNLLSHYDHSGDFQFFLIDDPSINAFALPGGFILVNYGLFEKTDSESELASVLAHEIAHVTQRHYARAYGLNKDSNLPFLAAIIAAVILGSQSKDAGQATQAAVLTAAAAQIQQKINFTRQNEQEADRIGIKILSDSGYDPEKMASFFDKIERESRLYGIDIPEFLRTHPVSSSRIADARDRARLLPKAHPPGQETYLLMRHRIQSLAATDKHQNEKNYQRLIREQSGDELTATRYGLVLSLIRVEQYKEALKQVNILLAKSPMRIAFILAKAQILAKAGQTDKAITTYQSALSLYPGNKSLLHDYIALLLAQKKYQLAMTELKQLLKKPVYNPIFYKYLAEAHARLGEQTESHEALAEYYYQRGQLHQALDQLDIAQKTTKDFYASSRIEAKRKQIQEEIPLEKNE